MFSLREIIWNALILLLCAVGVLDAPSHAADAAKNRKPNIVLIMADDLGYECIGANGSTSYQTPVLDQLAATGMRFEQCHAQPLCTPTRVELMAGLYNQRNYIRFGLLDPKAKTFAHMLKDAGYATCIAGKWQLGGGFEGPKHFGFDEYCLWQLTRRPARYANPGLEVNGKELAYTHGEYGPDLVNDYLCDFIQRHKDQPFFAYYPMMLTHGPYVPTPDSPDWDPKAMNDKGAKPKHFAEMAAYMDKMVGKVVRKLDELGLREKTILLFTGDNGTGKGTVSQMGSRTVVGGKGSTTDFGTHVPLIVNWPGTIRPGQVSQALVDFTDFSPTLAEVSDAKVAATQSLDGHSFLPVLLGQKEKTRDWIYAWYSPDGGPTGTEWARDQRYKLYRSGGFYDVVADPDENHRLPTDSLSGAAKAAHAKLQAALDQYANTRNPDAPRLPREKRKNRKAAADE